MDDLFTAFNPSEGKNIVNGVNEALNKACLPMGIGYSQIRQYNTQIEEIISIMRQSTVRSSSNFIDQ